MSLNNRQLAILSMLKAQKTLTVAEFSEKLFISSSTIRRDLDILENENLIHRTYGGASLIVDRNAEIPISIRESDNRVAKSVIGRTAASFVNNGDSIFLDSSSTVLSMLPYLIDKSGLTIITNGLKTSYDLSRYRTIKTICTGGKLRENSLSFIGTHAQNVLSFYYVDKLFFSTRSISAQYGLSDISEEESCLRHIMLKHTQKSFALIDSSKFDTLSLCTVCFCGDVDAIITDAPFKGGDKWKEVENKIIKAY